MTKRRSKMGARKKVEGLEMKGGKRRPTSESKIEKRKDIKQDEETGCNPRPPPPGKTANALGKKPVHSKYPDSAFASTKKGPRSEMPADIWGLRSLLPLAVQGIAMRDLAAEASVARSPDLSFHIPNLRVFRGRRQVSKASRRGEERGGGGEKGDRGRRGKEEG